MADATVVLVGGPPGGGKTTLGLALARRLESAYLTVDDMAVGLRAVTTRESHPGLHVMARAVTGMSSAEYFTQTPSDRLIADAEEQHRAVWPAVERLVHARAVEKSPIVIEGWYFWPEWVHGLDVENLASFWLNVDREVLEARERSSSFYDQSTDRERMLRNFLGRSYWYNDLVREQADRLGMNVLRQDGTVPVEALCDQVVRAV